MTGVSFGGTAATHVTVVSSTEVPATAPAGSGQVDVTVTGPAGTSTVGSGDTYTYVAASVPTVGAVDPSTGPVTGGNMVKIFGSGLSDATGVMFGSNPATTFTPLSDNEIVATAPAGHIGEINITVAGPNDTSAVTVNDHYGYLAVPQVSMLFPSVAAANSGFHLTFIVGQGFTGATAVRFGAVQAPFATLSSVVIMAFAPPEAVGKVNVQLQTATGTSTVTSGDTFTYRGRRAHRLGLGASAGGVAPSTSIRSWSVAADQLVASAR